MKTALYRHFDAAGQLLYIGISIRPFTRASEHRQRSDWFMTVARIEIEWFDTRADAEQAEWAAIKAERPPHNKAYTKRAPEPVERFIVLDRKMQVIPNASHPKASIVMTKRELAEHRQANVEARRLSSLSARVS